MDGLCYHLVNKAMTICCYLISRLLVRQEHLNYFIRNEKLFNLRPRYEDEWRKRGRHSKYLWLHIGCFFCIGKEKYGKSKWKSPWMEYGGS